MSNIFDIERAKAGDLVEYRQALGEWVQVHFIGTCSDGSPVVQNAKHLGAIVTHRNNLRMAPKKLKVRYRVALMRDDSGIKPVIADSSDYADFLEKESSGFVEWADDWKEAEVER